MRENDKCTFCEEETESVIHLFVYCPKVAQLWVQMEENMNKFSLDQINFSVDSVLWNRLVLQPIGHIKNFMCLVIKQYIYRQWCNRKPLNHHECLSYINPIERYEKYYAIKRNVLAKHNKKWFPNRLKINNTNCNE